MADHALVMGCDGYAQCRGADLRGAVADALDVREWLLRGARVPPENLVLLASPSAVGRQLPAGIEAPPVTRPSVAAAVAALVGRTDVGPRDRLFVYFAGHGCRSDPLNEALSLDMLVVSTYDPADPASGTVGLADLRSQLEQSRFGDVLLVVDACRNLLRDKPFGPARLGYDSPAPTDRGYFPRVYLAQATVPGGVATGSRDHDGTTVRGDFTAALLDGLRGTGTAHRFDEAAALPYAVTWSSLRTYVESRLAARDPRLQGDGDVVLARFPDGHFADVRLEIDVEPGGPGQPDVAVVVTYRDPTALDDPRRSLAGATPLRIDVPPRRHSVTARRGDFAGRVIQDVYADCRVTVPLSAVPDTEPLPRSGPVSRGDTSGSGLLRVDVSDDPAAVVRVLGPSGAVVLEGVGHVEGELPPRDYGVTVTGLAARPAEFAVAVDRGRLTRLVTGAPSLEDSLPQHYLRTDDARELSDGPLTAAGALVAVLGPPDPDDAPLLSVLAPDGLRVEVATWAGPDAEHLAVVEGPTGVLRVWAVPIEERWAVVGTAGHRLAVPVVPGAATVVVLAGRDRQVAVFDRWAQDHRSVLLQDRAQALLARGDERTAALVGAALLDHHPRPSWRRRPLLVMLRERLALRQPGTDRGGEAGAGLASLPFAVSAPPAVRPLLLPGSAWASVLDAPLAADALADWPGFSYASTWSDA